MLIGRMESDGPPVGLRLEARGRGSPYRYCLVARVETEGVRVEEATPGLKGLKALLVPYLRDPGTGTLTDARVESGGVRLIHGREEV